MPIILAAFGFVFLIMSVGALIMGVQGHGNVPTQFKVGIVFLVLAAILCANAWRLAAVLG